MEWTREPVRFVKETIDKATKDSYPILGEFDVSHYSSPRQVKCNELYRDVRIITVDFEVQPSSGLFYRRCQACQ